jgi:hypothetical protein
MYLKPMLNSVPFDTHKAHTVYRTKLLDPYIVNSLRKHDVCDKSRLTFKTFFDISHTFARDTTDLNLSFSPISMFNPPNWGSCGSFYSIAVSLVMGLQQ